MRAVLTSLALLAASPAWAEPAASVRVGDHPGFGRIVFDLPSPSTFEVVERGNRALVIFSGAPAIGMPDNVPRNVLSVVGGNGAATLVLAPGAKIRSAQMGSRVVVDILDPSTPRGRAAALPPALTPAPASAAAVRSPAPAPPQVVQPATSLPAKQEGPPEGESSAKVSALTPTPTPTPEPVVATAAPVEPALAEGPFRIEAGPGVGAAAFRRGTLGMVVFDERLGATAEQAHRAAGFTEAKLDVVGNATILTVPLSPDESISVTRDSGAWLVARAASSRPAVEQVATADGIALKLEQPGHVLAVQDPVTGQVLLVGTSSRVGQGASVPVGRAAPGYTLLTTWLGIALEPTSDRVDLRASREGFILVSPEAAPSVLTEAATPASKFDLPSAPLPVLTKRLYAQIAGAAELPPRARGPERIAAAKTMLSLGMGAEAQALLTVAMADDPAVANDPLVSGLLGIAAVIAGRASEATGLDDHRLDGSSEVALWRGVRDVVEGKPSEQLIGQLGTVMAYSDTLQRRLLPTVAEAAIRTGRPFPLDTTLPDAPALAFARALQKERAGETDAALAALDAIVAGRDQSDAVRAAIGGAELRLTAGRITPASAADIIERQSVAWRGDAREVAARLRVAELRTKAGSWRAALESLKDTEALFPNAKSETNSRKADVFKALLATPKDAVRPLELVTLAGDFADSIPTGAPGEAVAGLLADKLLALDLPSRAGPVLQTLMQGAQPGPVKAEFGTRLAQLHLDNGEPAKAEAALKSSDTAELSVESREGRGLLLARARAGQGDVSGAAEVLTAIGSPASDDLRATLLAQSGNWAGSLAAVSALVAKTVPVEGELSERQQDTVLRQATAAVQARDAEAVRALRRFEARMTPPRVDLLRTLTASPVQTPGDLPRAAREIAMVRAMPERLQALGRQ